MGCYIWREYGISSLPPPPPPQKNRIVDPLLCTSSSVTTTRRIVVSSRTVTVSCLCVLFTLARTVSEEFSSSGDSKTEEDGDYRVEKRSPKEKESKDKGSKGEERDEGKSPFTLSHFPSESVHNFGFCQRF